MRIELGIVGFDVTVPQVGRKRLAFTVTLSAIGSALWIGAPVWSDHLPLLPPADLTWRLVVVGLLFPAWVGFLALLLMEKQIERDRAKAEETRALREARERARVMAR